MVKCDYCGRQVQPVVITEGRGACIECAKYFGTCYMCRNCSACQFENNPSPLPKVVSRTIQRGNAVIQTQVRNPERVKQFCFPCKCFDMDDLICRRQENWCSNYDEYIPELPHEDLSE
jgi:hypothetical protein